MKRVNLSRRPFVNQRPIFRLGIVLWVLGGLLVLLNVGLFKSYWSDSRDVRVELAMADEQAEQQLEQLELLDRQVKRIDLSRKNSQAIYLNSLISFRTFPWSALFDDLERVMPRQVRLLTVSPALRLAANQAVEEAERLARQERTSRRQRARRSSRRGEQASEDSNAAPATSELQPDEVMLQLRGTAETEDALIDFIDTLYRDPTFRQPVLSVEVIEKVGTSLSSSFDLTVVYLTRGEISRVADVADSSDEDPALEPSPDATASGDNTEPSRSEVLAGSLTPSMPEIRSLPEDDAAAREQVRQLETAARQPPAPSSDSPLRRSEVDPSREAEESARRARAVQPDADTPQEGADSVAAERRRRIEELRERRRAATERSRTRTRGTAGGRPPTGGFLGSAGSRDRDNSAGESPPRPTARPGRTPRSGSSGGGSTSEGGNPSTDGAETPASGTPRVTGSLLPGLPELLEGWWHDSFSPFEESLLEDLG